MRLFQSMEAVIEPVGQLIGSKCPQKQEQAAASSAACNPFGKLRIMYFKYGEYTQERDSEDEDGEPAGAAEILVVKT